MPNEAMVAQLWGDTKNHSVVQFTRMDSTVWKLYLNKAGAERRRVEEGEKVPPNPGVPPKPAHSLHSLV